MIEHNARLLLVESDPVSVGDLYIDPTQNLVMWKGYKIDMTTGEVVVLMTLTERAGTVKTRDWIVNNLYDDADVIDRAVDSHIKRIRKRFREVDPDFDMIETVYGVGYRWNNTPVVTRTAKVVQPAQRGAGQVRIDFDLLRPIGLETLFGKAA